MVEQNKAAQMQTPQGKSILQKWLDDVNLSKITENLNYSISKIENTNTINVQYNPQKSAVIAELNKTHPNWYDQFIHSPL